MNNWPYQLYSNHGLDSGPYHIITATGEYRANESEMWYYCSECDRKRFIKSSTLHMYRVVKQTMIEDIMT